MEPEKKAVRASILPILQHCGHAQYLQEQYPSGNKYASAGTSFHEEISEYIKTGRVGPDKSIPGIIHALPPHKSIESEVQVEVADPETSETLVRGTCDVVLTLDDGSLLVGDWKTGSQSKVDPPNENLQLMAYSLALAIARGAPKYRPFLYFTKSGFEWGEWVAESEYWDRLAKIKAALGKDPLVPVIGDHCDRCYSRQHCASYMLPATENPEAALIPITVHNQITKHNATDLLRLVDAVEKAVVVAKARLRDFARDNGGIKSVDGKRVWTSVEVNGRKSVSLERAEAAGLMTALEEAGCINEGRSYESYRWVNATRGK